MRRPGQKTLDAWILLAPALLVLGLFVVWPMLRAIGWSLQSVSILDPDRAAFVGLANYSQLLSDPRFRTAFGNTALFAVYVVPIQTALAFFLALWVNRPEPAWRWLRGVFFFPMVISMPVLAVLWTLLYQPAEAGQMGLVNRAISLFGLPPQDWLQDPALALPAIAAMSVWQGVGFQMMIFLAGLQNLSTEQLEAARIDGANASQRLLFVILPGMRHSILFVAVTTTILSFRLFVQPYLMTRGGPEDRTLSLIQMIYETTFIERDLGLAAAGTFLFLLVVLVVTWIQHRMEGRWA